MLQLIIGHKLRLQFINTLLHLFDIHTFRERMPVSSVQRTWKLVLEVLKRMK